MVGREFTESEVVSEGSGMRAIRRTVLKKNGPKICRSSDSRETGEHLQGEGEEPSQGGKLKARLRKNITGMYQSPLL